MMRKRKKERREEGKEERKNLAWLVCTNCRQFECTCTSGGSETNEQNNTDCVSSLEKQCSISAWCHHTHYKTPIYRSEKGISVP